MPWRPRATVPSRSKRSRSGAETEHFPAQYTPGLEPGVMPACCRKAIIHRRLERIPNALERNSSSRAQPEEAAWRRGAGEGALATARRKRSRSVHLRFHDVRVGDLTAGSHGRRNHRAWPRQRNGGDARTARGLHRPRNQGRREQRLAAAHGWRHGGNLHSLRRRCGNGQGYLASRCDLGRRRSRTRSGLFLDGGDAARRGCRRFPNGGDAARCRRYPFVSLANDGKHGLRRCLDDSLRRYGARIGRVGRPENRVRR